MGKTDLRALQLFELDMLRDVKRVFEANHLRYFLADGTLLGAVRHQGFIPWDDDIDVAMPYPDFLSFLSLGQEALGDRYFLQTTDTDESFQFGYARVRRNHSTMIRTWEFDEGHHGVWLDIFPLIYVGGSMDLKLKKVLIPITNVLCLSQNCFDRNRNWMRQNSGRGKIALVSILRSLLGKNRKRCANWIRRKIFSQTGKARMAEVWGSITAVVPASLYEEPAASIPFEDTLCAVPLNYDTVLRANYGDYMKLPPEEDRHSNHGNMYIDLERDWATVKQQGDAPDLDSLGKAKS